MISIKDIAQAARVSHSTVSRALRDSPLVNPQTRALIHRIAEEQGYFRRIAAGYTTAAQVSAAMEPELEAEEARQSVGGVALTFDHLAAGLRGKLHFKLVASRRFGWRWHKADRVARSETGQGVPLDPLQNAKGFAARH